MPSRLWSVRRASRRAALAFALAVAVAPFPVRAGGDWNDARIAWRPYDEGLVEARAQRKPVCLIIFTTWCSHCTNYTRVFHDPAVVEMSRRFVMIRVDRDQHKDVSARHAPDGEYVPRTQFLTPGGELIAEAHAPRDRFLYFFDERRPGGILAGMQSALRAFEKIPERRSAPAPAGPAGTP